MDSCPYCKKVTDLLKENNIDYHKFDVINNDNALKLLEIGGKDQVPFLYDEENNKKIYDSEKIIDYINKIKK